MRARIKVSAFTQGVTVADLLRALLERNSRRSHHMPHRFDSIGTAIARLSAWPTACR
jgi:hypothetical protein